MALLQRGGCFFRQKLENAAAAGAAAIVVMNEGNPGRRALFQATLTSVEPWVHELPDGLDLRGMLAANLWLRCGMRVLWTLAEFPAPDADALYQGVRGVDWR